MLKSDEKKKKKSVPTRFSRSSILDERQRIESEGRGRLKKNVKKGLPAS